MTVPILLKNDDCLYIVVDAAADCIEILYYYYRYVV